MRFYGFEAKHLRTLAAGLLAPLLLFGSGCKSRNESRGDVALNWVPRPGNAIQAVPLDQVKHAIDVRLAASPPASVSADRWHHVHTVYRTFAGSPLWLRENGTDPQRAPALIDALTDATNDALDFDDIPLADLQRALAALKQTKQPTAEQLADADVLLTSAYVTLGEDLLTGQLDPRKMSQAWHINPQEEHVDSALVRSLRNDSLAASIAAMRPQDPGYEGLRKALATYRGIVSRGGWPTVPAGRALKPGQTDSPQRLQALRARLAAEGLIAGDSSATATAAAAGGSRAVYDRQLAGALAEFQARHAIGVDSVLGSETVDALNKPADYRLGQIAANLERYRWMPRSFGSRYIIVNVPAFRLEAYDSGQKALDMKVIVGAEYEGRRTPVFSDYMQYVVFRPYWLVTDSIAAKEIWPKVDADPGYLDRNNYQVYDDHGTRRIRQLPGPKNSLGLVKFMFPNDFNIYLHDTPEDQLFEKDVRAFSHGCIRLEKPAQLASWVLGWPMDRVQRQMQDGPDNRQVDLPHNIPVYIVYFTAYMRDGQLYFGNDLYERDDAMVQAVSAGASPSAATLQSLQSLKQLAS